MEPGGHRGGQCPDLIASINKGRSQNIRATGVDAWFRPQEQHGLWEEMSGQEVLYLGEVAFETEAISRLYLVGGYLFTWGSQKAQRVADDGREVFNVKVHYTLQAKQLPQRVCTKSLFAVAPTGKTILIHTNPDEYGMQGTTIAWLCAFLSIMYEYTQYQCALVEWFELDEDQPDPVTEILARCILTAARIQLTYTIFNSIYVSGDLD
ncbi:hypothetical protein V8D89_004249 [Ganoderma adspersum]